MQISSEKSGAKDKAAVRILRQLGNVALGRAFVIDDSRIYDEVMQDSIPEWVHRQLFQIKLASS